MPTEDLFANKDPREVEVGDKPGGSLPIEQGESKKAPTAETGDLLLDWIKRELKENDPHIQTFRENATLAYKFDAGHQLEKADQAVLDRMGRPSNAFNTTQKFLRYVSGIERRSPEALIYRADDEYDSQAEMDSEGVTRGFEWVNRRGDGDIHRSRAFFDMLVSGVGCEDWYLDVVSDPRPMPKPKRVSVFECLWPQCDEQNNEGTRWRGREVEMSWMDIKTRWGAEAGELARTYSDPGKNDGRPDPKEVKYILPYTTTENYAPKQPRKAGKAKVLEFQWWSDEAGYAFQDPLSQKDSWLSEEHFARYKRTMDRVGPAIEGEEDRVRRIFRRIFLLERKHQLGEPGRLPGNRFTLNFMTGCWDEDEKQWFGFMRVLMDPQRYANKFLNQMLEIIGAQAKGGMLYEDGAIDNRHRRDIENTFAKPGSFNMVARDAIAQNRLMPKPLPQVSPGTLEILKYAASSQESVSGINPASMGLDQGGNVPQGTMRQRQASGLVLFSAEFDSLSKFRKEEGRIVLGFLKLIADGRAIGPNSPYESVVYKLDPKMFDREYDIFLDDTVYDPSLRARWTQNIMQLAPTLLRMGKFLPSFWNYFDLPVREREELKKAFQDDEQKRLQMMQMGIAPGGRGQPRDPKEQAAKIGKLAAETELIHARATSMGPTRKARDFRTLVSALSEAERVKQEGEQHRMERDFHKVRHAKEMTDTAKGIADLFTGGLPPRGGGA